MKDARCTAAQALMRQYSANAYSNLVIEPLIAKNRLSPRDAAFASALFYTALERMLTLDHILRKYCSRPPER
ncbi:transcription antitermination factor NusB, partial [Anaerotruncus rubiinfantis]